MHNNGKVNHYRYRHPNVLKGLGVLIDYREEHGLLTTGGRRRDVSGVQE
jgi:hypothetical protein